MQKRQLIVFGDSFNAISGNPIYKGTHWSELLADDIGFDLVSLAKSGVSTRHVVLQVLESLNEKYIDPIIIGTQAASHFREEILTYADKWYDIDIDYNSVLPCDTGFIDSINIGTIMTGMSTNEELNLKQTDVEYLLTRRAMGMNHLIDKWAMFYALLQLKKNNKNFLYFQKCQFDDFIYFHDDEIKYWLDCKNVIFKNELDLGNYHVDRVESSDFDDPGYHTTQKDQIKIKDIIKNKLIEGGIL